MAATVTSALTNVSLVNSSTGFSVWKRDGTGGTPSAVSETDVYLQGTGACSIKVSNQGIALAYGTGGINLSATGTHVYIWCNMLAGGLMASRANNGLCIILSSDTTLSSGSNYSMWAVDGADTYPGGWVRYVIDVSKTRTTGAGTLNLSAVRHIGMYCDTRPNTAKFDNLVIDRIDYTSGAALRVTGTSTTDDAFGDILAADQGTVGNKYGIVTSREGVIYCRGRLLLGDNVGTASTSLTDVDRVVVMEEPQYYNGSSVVPCMASGFCGIEFVGNGTGTTSIQWGKKVGTGDTARGRNGLTLLAEHAGAEVLFDDGNVDSALIYGTKFQSFSGAMTWGTNTAHELIGCTVDNCASFDPVGGVILRNNVFSGNTGTTGALTWNASINIKNCNFIANADGTNDPAGVYVPSGVSGPLTFDNLQFSGNDVDIRWGASSGTLTVNSTNASNPSTTAASGTASVSIVNAVNITLTNLIAGSRVYIENQTDATVLFNEVEPTTTFSDSVNYTGNKTLLIRVRNASGGTKYKAFETGGTLTSNGFSAQVNQIPDE